MTENQQVDLDRLTAFCDHLIGQGVHAITALGSTGEYYALSPKERTDVLQTVLDVCQGRVPVLAGTNAASTREVIDYSQQAQAMGAAGLLLAAPYYSLPTPDELYAHFEAVNQAVKIPIMLYNYPGRTGVDLLPDLVARLAELSQVEYIKESTGDITRVSTILKLCGDKIKVFCGADTIPVECFMLGAVGWVGGIANVLPKTHVKIYDLAVTQNDLTAARDFFFQAWPALNFIETSGIYTQLVKAGCQIKGHPAGPPRQPLQPVSKEKYAELEKVLKGLD
jgi:4-hydroxy-tetrahydrodipicolinate synthase